MEPFIPLIVCKKRTASSNKATWICEFSEENVEQTSANSEGVMGTRPLP